MESLRSNVGLSDQPRTCHSWNNSPQRSSRHCGGARHVFVPQSIKKGAKGHISAPKDGGGRHTKTLDVVETVVLGTAVVSHTLSLRKMGADSSNSRHHEQFLSGCILISLVLRKAVSGMYEKRRESSPTSQAMLRLRNAESAIEDQVKVLDVVLKDMDALKTRSRLVGRDVKGAVKHMEQTQALTGDVLRDTNARMDMLEDKVGDMEGLIGSVHEVVSKQLNLIQDVIREQKTLGQKVEQTSTMGSKKEGTQHENLVTMTTTSSSSSIEEVSAISSKTSTDEWGRAQPVISVAPQHNSKDGSVLFSFDSN